jgi:hypothetical protein
VFYNIRHPTKPEKKRINTLNSAHNESSPSDSQSEIAELNECSYYRQMDLNFSSFEVNNELAVLNGDYPPTYHF